MNSRTLRPLIAGAALGLALCLPLTSQAQLAGGQSINLSIFTTDPTVPLEGNGGGAYNFVIGTTNATIAPIDISRCKNIGWTLEAQATNTTSVVGVGFAFFNDVSSARWNTAVSNTPPNNTSFRYMALTASTKLQGVTTNWSTDGYLYCLPLYLTNTSQMVSNTILRYDLKPGL
jgi:hypothetical protein